MTLSRQVIYVGAAAFLFLMVCICYLRIDGVKRLAIDTPPKSRHHESGSTKIRSFVANLDKLLVRGHNDEDMYSHGNKTEVPIPIQTSVIGVMPFLWKTFPLKSTQDIISKGGKSSNAPVKNGTSQESASEHSMDLTIAANRGSVTSCKPLTHIVFFKMHKCSSSTVQNILFRFGEERDLNFVLPSAGNYLGHSSFNKRYMIQFPVKEYNILCHHTVFSATGMAEVMPINSLYVTVLRNPVLVFESLFSYNNMAYVYRLPTSWGLELFFDKPDYYYRKSDGGVFHVKNPMLYDLGLPNSLLGDNTAIDEKIEETREQFDLVMMTEYFEESLILLRELMCWDTDDVVYFVHNARSNSSVKSISPRVADKIRKWNYGDVKLYDTFNRTFWEKVEAFGHDRMRQEVAKLRQRNHHFMQHCIAEVTNTNWRVWHPPGIPVDSVLLKPEASKDTMCVRMAEPELLYTDHLRQIQKRRYKMT